MYTTSKRSSAPERLSLLIRTFAIVAMVACIPRLSDAAQEGTVHLKNGGRLHGDLIEVMPGQHVTIGLADGTTRKLHWEEVSRVQEKQALATSSQTSSAERRAAAGAMAVVSVGADKPGVTVSEVTGRMVASSGTATAVGISYRTLCTAPCSFEIPEGTHEFVADGPGYTAALERFTLKGGDNTLHVRPGSAALRLGGYVLLSLGLTAAITGGVFMGFKTVDYETGEEKSRSWALPALISGLAGAAGGVTLWVLGATSFEQREGPRYANSGKGALVSYSGAF